MATPFYFIGYYYFNIRVAIFKEFLRGFDIT